MPLIAPRPITAGTQTSHDRQRRTGTGAGHSPLPARTRGESQPPAPEHDSGGTGEAGLDASGAIFTTALIAGSMTGAEPAEFPAAPRQGEWLAPTSELRLRDRKI